MAPIQTHEQARDQAYLITWKLRRPLQLLGEPVIVGLPRTQGQVPALGECILKLTPGLGKASEIHQAGRRGHLSQGVTMKRPLSKGDSSTEGSGQGKEGSTGIQLDHHLQPCLLTMCSGGMLFTNNPDVSETFPSQVYILNVLHSS